MLLLPLKQINKLVESFSTNKITLIKLDDITLYSKKKKVISPFACCITYNYNKDTYNLYLLDLLGIRIINEIEITAYTHVFFTPNGKYIKVIDNNYKDEIPIIDFIKKYKWKEYSCCSIALELWYTHFLYTREVYLRLKHMLKISGSVVTLGVQPASCAYSLFKTRDELFNSLKSMIDNYPII